MIHLSSSATSFHHQNPHLPNQKSFIYIMSLFFALFDVIRVHLEFLLYIGFHVLNLILAIVQQRCIIIYISVVIVLWILMLSLVNDSSVVVGLQLILNFYRKTMKMRLYTLVAAKSCQELVTIPKKKMSKSRMRFLWE